MGRVGTILVGGLVAVSGPAWAQSLINGAQLQYNYAYHCNGERVIVAHCRDDSDQSYCQVVYPDRPEVNGNQVAPVEMRGDIVAKLDACTRPKGTSVASSQSNTPSGANDEMTRPATGVPGLGKASWSVLDLESDHIELFAKAHLKRTGNLRPGWFTTVYPRPIDHPEVGINGVEFEQYRWEADCTKGLIRITAIAFFDDNEKLIKSTSGNSKWDKTEPGTFGDRKFRVLCGKPQALADKKPLVGDGDYIAMYTAAMLAKKNGQ